MRYLVALVFGVLIIDVPGPASMTAQPAGCPLSVQCPDHNVTAYYVRDLMVDGKLNAVYGHSLPRHELRMSCR
jgi:hypothetical protein